MKHYEDPNMDITTFGIGGDNETELDSDIDMEL